MKKTNKLNNVQIQDQIISIGKDLSVIHSLIIFLEASLCRQLEIKNADIQNLVSIINSFIEKLIEKQDNLENILEM